MLCLSALLAVALAVFCGATDYGVQRTDFVSSPILYPKPHVADRQSQFEDLGDTPGAGNAPPINSDRGIICAYTISQA